jgi:hypothetical protein
LKILTQEQNFSDKNISEIKNTISNIINGNFFPTVAENGLNNNEFE